MTPKEKAEELVSRYKREILRGKYRIDGFVIEELAEECALIAVDEIIKLDVFDCNDEWSYEDCDTREYWKQVKQEIEKL
jgi:hypothetical protein